MKIFRSLPAVTLLVAAMALAAGTTGFSQTQTIVNNGFCNIIIQGNNNSGTYFHFCPPRTSAESNPPFDPPELSLGMDFATVNTLLGSRDHDVMPEDGNKTIISRGTLFDLPGTTRYGFNASDKLSWTSVETQCSEVKHDYARATRPPDLNPSWEEWHNTWDIRISYDTTTSCAKILNLFDTLPKLFGQPVSDRHGDELRTPNESEVCLGIVEGPWQPCKNTGALRLTFIQDFIGRDRVTGIGLEVRELLMHGDIQEGDYTPEIRRREFAAIVSVWGPDGRPSISGDFKGRYWPYLLPGDAR